MSVYVTDGLPFANLFKLLYQVRLASGGINRHEPAPARFFIPDQYCDRLVIANWGCRDLTDQELEIMGGDGEEGEIQTLAASRPGLKAANELAEAEFNGELEDP